MTAWLYNFLYPFRIYFDWEIVVVGLLCILTFFMLQTAGRIQLGIDKRIRLYRAFRSISLNRMLWLIVCSLSLVIVVPNITNQWKLPLTPIWWSIWVSMNLALIAMSVASTLTLKLKEEVPSPCALEYTEKAISLGMGLVGPRNYFVTFLRESSDCVSIHLRSAHPLSWLYGKLPRRTDNSRFVAYILKKYGSKLKSAGVRRVEITSHYVQASSLVNREKVLSRARDLFHRGEIELVVRELGWWKRSWIKILSLREPPEEVKRIDQAVGYVVRLLLNPRRVLSGILRALCILFGSERKRPLVSRGIIIELV